MKPENETFAGCCFLGFFGHILHINENILQLPLVIVPNQKHLKFVKKIIIEEKKIRVVEILVPELLLRQVVLN